MDRGAHGRGCGLVHDEKSGLFTVVGRQLMVATAILPDTNKGVARADFLPHFENGHGRASHLIWRSHHGAASPPYQSRGRGRQQAALFGDKRVSAAADRERDCTTVDHSGEDAAALAGHRLAVFPDRPGALGDGDRAGGPRPRGMGSRRCR